MLKITKLKKKIPVYDITVEKNENFFANDILIHNCVEIQQNTSPSIFKEETIEGGEIVIRHTPWDFVVCNLASINVAKVNTQEDIDKIIPIAMRVLDNVIDLNFYPIKEAKLTSQKYRSVGLGFLGLAEYLANKTNENTGKPYMYGSNDAKQHVDELFERYAYATISGSMELSKERGSYKLFPWSEWSKGIFFGKSEQQLHEQGKLGEKWSKLIEEVKKYGVRNGYMLAPAPNTSTALVVGTTASVLPIFRKFYRDTNAISPQVIVAPNLNKRNFWSYKEYLNLDLADVIETMARIYKWIDQSISFEFMIDPNKESPNYMSPKRLYESYMKSWKEGIKTVYYVRSLSLKVDDCASCSG